MVCTATPKNSQNNDVYASAAPKKETYCTKLSAINTFNLQQVSDGLRSIQVRANWPDIRQRWSEDQSRDTDMLWLKIYCLHCVRPVPYSQQCCCCCSPRVDTILLERQTPAFISPHLWHPTDLSALGYKRWGEMQQQSTKFMTSMNWSSAWLISGMVLSNMSSMTQVINGANVSVWVFFFYL